MIQGGEKASQNVHLISCPVLNHLITSSGRQMTTLLLDNTTEYFRSVIMHRNEVQPCQDADLSNHLQRACHEGSHEDSYDQDLYKWTTPKNFTCSKCGSHRYTVLTESMVYQCYCCHHQTLDY